MGTIHLPWTTTQLSFSEWLLAVNEDVQQPFYLLHIITLLLQQCHELDPLARKLGFVLHSMVALHWLVDLRVPTALQGEASRMQV